METEDKLIKELLMIEKQLNQEAGKKEILESQLKDISLQIEKDSDEVVLLEKVSALYQMTSEYAREQAKKQIELLVSKCLQYIFESNIQFKIELEMLRNVPHAEFWVVSEYEDQVVENIPHLSRGGGVVDVVSLALRIAFLEVLQPKINGPLVLDEPGKHVSSEYIYNVGSFLQESTNMFNRQIIMVTHNQHLSALGDKVYYVKNDKGSSIIQQVEDLTGSD